MGGLTSKLTSVWKSSELNVAKTDFVEEPYDEFVKDVLNAMKMGNYERLKELQEEAGMMMWGGIENINITPSVIQSAAMHGREDILQYLIDLGIDVDQTDTCGMTALHEACKGKSLGCVQLLVTKSRNIDIRDVWGRSPLIKALVYRNSKAAELLLERGANPNAVDIYGMTPLSTAIDYNLIDMLKVLVRHGADINLITQHMYKCSGPPLYQAINNQNLAMVNELIQLGATTQPRSQDYICSSRSGVANAWHYFSGSVSLFPTLQHANAVIMAMSEFVKRSHNIEISGPGMDILMVLIAAHGHPLSSYFDVMIRVLINSYPNDFSLLLNKLEVCSSSGQDFLTGSGARESNQRPQARPQHLQQLDHHLRRANGGQPPPRFVMSLENQARKVARQAVMASGRNVTWAVKRLQCPPALKSLLLLKDIDKAFSAPVWKGKRVAVLS